MAGGRTEKKSGDGSRLPFGRHGRIGVHKSTMAGISRMAGLVGMARSGDRAITCVP